MRKSLLSLLALELALTAAVPALGAPTLRQTVIVTGDTVRLADLVLDSGDAGSAVVALSPRPGETLSFAASDVVKVARGHGVEVTENPGVTTVMVERAARLITAKEIGDTLNQALIERGNPGPITVNLFNRRIEIRVPAEGDAGIEILTLDYDRTSGQLWAVLRAPAGDPRAEKIQVQGHVDRLRQVPVLRAQMIAGAVLKTADLEWRSEPEAQLNAMVITEEVALVGQALRRTIGPGVPLAVTDVERPVLVQRNDLVTMLYVKPGIALTSTGRAIDSGCLGDVIHVTNPKTNRTVEATITGTDEVLIRARIDAVTLKTAAAGVDR